MNVTFDKEAFKRQIINRELDLIQKMQEIPLRRRGEAGPGIGRRRSAADGFGGLTMSECKFKRPDGSCEILSDDEVKEYCVEGPCTREEEEADGE